MRAVSFSTNWFLDPIIYGVYPKEMRDLLGPILPEFSSSNLEILKSGLDFIGINHYATFYAKDCLFSTCETINGNSREEGFVVQTMLKNGVPISEKTGLDYLDVYPQGIEKVVTYTKEKYPNIPIHITENGYCDKTTSNSSMEEVLDDIKRVDFLAGYLNVLGNAIGKGADVRGYFVWSLLDNFEWTYGYSKRMGLHHVDRVTLRRTPKLSAKWYKQFIAENQRLKKKMLKTNY
ncbi:unnamed protein product [Cuscuta epithymum]|uniref:Beta-glucosidase n=1 Tax=Cuscuta epithymum TaxID=186058 RepID=A0AAV0G1W2_9ASTE|nr:unnamed protein product [Cuscuta epithymum]